MRTHLNQILTIVFLLYSICANAQFPSSETVYCYIYDYSDNDGIKSRIGADNEIYFVNFQKRMLGFASVSTMAIAQNNMLKSPNYYSEQAINHVATQYSEWKKSPYGMITMGPASAYSYVEAYLYNSQNSTSKRYTYQSSRKYARQDMNPYTGWIGSPYWTDPEWGTRCFSFTLDKNEMIVWKTTDPGNRTYYKRVSLSAIKPDTSFLDD